MYPVACLFPGCGQLATVAHGPDGEEAISLCFDHRQLLFYDEDEFDRLWAERDSDADESG